MAPKYLFVFTDQEQVTHVLSRRDLDVIKSRTGTTPMKGPEYAKKVVSLDKAPQPAETVRWGRFALRIRNDKANARYYE